MMKCLFLFAALVSLAAGQEFPTTTTFQPLTPLSFPQQPPTFKAPSLEPPPVFTANEAPHDAMRLRCQDENGTVPYWLDKTCRSYLSCVMYNMSLQSCPKGEAYSFANKTCLPAGQVHCVKQNQEFADVIKHYMAPHFYKRLPLPTRLPLVPFSASNSGTTFRDLLLGHKDHFNSTEWEEELLEAEEKWGVGSKDGEMTIDLDDLPSILVDSTNAINITLPEDTCRRLAGEDYVLQTSMNQAMLMLVGCPDESCDIPLFHVNC